MEARPHPGARREEDEMARRRRRRRARAGDWAALAVVVGVLVWAFAPGVGWDLFDLGGQSGDGAAQSDGLGVAHRVF